jgi:hypothetical protein
VDSPGHGPSRVDSVLGCVPSMKARQLLAVLTRPPLRYYKVLVQQVGLSVQEASRCVRTKRERPDRRLSLASPNPGDYDASGGSCS